MELTRGITLDDELLAELCRRHGIRRLALFGSALHDQLRPDSDIDLLVEFAPGHTPGLLGIAAIELELERLVERRVDLRTPADLSRYFRDTVTAEARPLYDAA
jgi:predicted nucleotidyltransferase